MTPSPTEINCQTNLNNGIDRLSVEPTLIVVLLESNPNYYAYSQKGVSFLFDALSNSITTGDELLMLQMESKIFEDALIASGSVDDISPPALPPTMTPYPLIPPVSTYDPNCLKTRTSFACNNEKEHATETFAAVIVTETYQALMSQCFDQERTRQVGILEKEWEIAKTTAIAEFSNQIQNEATVEPDDQDIISNQVYEGLSNASLAFANLCHKFKKCKLIIFSDLTDWRYGVQPENITIVLNNVEVLTVMLNCERIFQPSCQRWQDIFRPKFGLYGAQSIDFIDGEKTVKELIDFIER